MRDAHGANPVALRQPQRHLKQSRQHVHVLMTIQMRGLDPCVPHLSNLRVPLALDLLQPQPPAQPPDEKGTRRAAKLSFAIDQARHLPRLERRPSIAQVQVDSNTQFFFTARQLHCAGKRRAVRQERRACDDPLAVRFGDPAVHSLGPAEVICVDDESSQGMSDAAPGRLFLARLRPCPRTFARVFGRCPSGQFFLRARTIDRSRGQL
jgi:hypothetical protein